MSSSCYPEALAQFDALPASAYVRLPTVCALYDSSRATIWRWVAQGRIPKPHKLTPQTTVWRVGELRAALAARAEAA